MAFANDPTFIDGLTYSALEVRLADAMMLQANGNAGGAVGGIRPGDTGLAVSVAGTTITVTAGVAALFYPAFGLYRACASSSSTLTVSAADPTNPRVDLVYLRVWDNAVDGAGLSKADVQYQAGTPAVSPVAPTPTAPMIYIPLATIAVPKVGGGSASVSSAVRPVTVAPGGISPSASAAGTYAGQYRDTGVAAGTLQRFNGTVWQDLLALAAAGQVNIGASPSAAAFAAILATAATQLLASRVITSDTVDRFKLTADGTMSWGSGSAATDAALTRSGVAQMTLTGALTATGMVPVQAEDTTSRTTTSTTYVSLGSFAPTITVPPSGRVTVDLRVTARNSTTNNSLSTFNASGSSSGTNHTGTDNEALIVNGTNDVSLSMKRLLTGLTPGETLTVTPAHRVNAASTLTRDYCYVLLEPKL